MSQLKIGKLNWQVFISRRKKGGLKEQILKNIKTKIIF